VKDFSTGFRWMSSRREIMHALSFRTLTARIRLYLELTKPRIVLLLLFTMLTAMIVAAHGIPGANVLSSSLLAGGMAAGGASALNQYFDRDIDARMKRTARRPIPSGRLDARHALVFGCALVIASLVIFAVVVNALTAFLVAVGELYYVGLYTLLLKRNSSVNIVLGGGAGALPVLIGWSAITGALSTDAWLLFLIIFYWTPPHSWALALLVSEDYARAGVPMMPVACGEATTRRQIVLYSTLLVVVTLFPVATHQLGPFYLVAALMMGIGLLVASVRLLRQADKAMARRVYRYSTTYLALLFIAMLIDKLI
jgi:protoheme IX farnesyltransferase